MSTMRVNTLVAQSGSAISLNSSLIVTGDLTVIGDNFTATVQDLTVTDQNITVNNGGNDATSEGAGLTVFRTGTFGSLVYANALASKWACGALGSESEIVTVGTVQTLTAAKTFSALVTASAGLNVTTGNLAIGTSTPNALLHVRGSGTAAATTTPGILFQNTSSGSAGLYVVGAAGSSTLNIGFAGGPGTGFNTFADAFKMNLEGASAGKFEIGPANTTLAHQFNGSQLILKGSNAGTFSSFNVDTQNGANKWGFGLFGTANFTLVNTAGSDVFNISQSGELKAGPSNTFTGTQTLHGHRIILGRSLQTFSQGSIGISGGGGTYNTNIPIASITAGGILIMSFTDTSGVSGTQIFNVAVRISGGGGPDVASTQISTVGVGAVIAISSNAGFVRITNNGSFNLIIYGINFLGSNI